MIKKLRMKFILVSMLSLLIVLTIIMGTINLFNYRQVGENADDVLDVLTEHDGMFPENEKGDGDSGTGEMDGLSPEVPFESRYFSVVLNRGGDAVSVDIGNIAAVDQNKAI